MEYLIKKGVPQRKAHHLIGKLVKTATEQNVTLAELPLETFHAADENLDESVYDVLGVRRAIESFQSVGSTAPDRVAVQVEVWKSQLN